MTDTAPTVHEPTNLFERLFLPVILPGTIPVLVVTSWGFTHHRAATTVVVQGAAWIAVSTWAAVRLWRAAKLRNA